MCFGVSAARLRVSFAAIAASRIARAEKATKLVFVPTEDLSVLDPVLTGLRSTRNHAYLVFDTLYGIDTSWGGAASDGRRAPNRGGRAYLDLKIVCVVSCRLASARHRSQPMVCTTHRRRKADSNRWSPLENGTALRR